MNFKIWLEEDDASAAAAAANDPKVAAMQKQIGPQAAQMVKNANGKINPRQALNTVVAQKLAKGDVDATKLTPPVGGIQSPIGRMKKKSNKK